MKLPHGEDSRQFWQDYLSHRRNHHFTTVQDHAPPTDAKAWEDNDIVIRRKWLETRFEEMDHMRNIMTWHNDEFPTKEPKYVIPESFLWKIFDNLAEAYLMLGRGEVGETLGDEGPEHSGWQEMVHRDGHPGNIFIKSVDGTLGRAVKSSGDYRYEIFQEKDVRCNVGLIFLYRVNEGRHQLLCWQISITHRLIFSQRLTIMRTIPYIMFWGKMQIG